MQLTLLMQQVDLPYTGRGLRRTFSLRSEDPYLEHRLVRRFSRSSANGTVRVLTFLDPVSIAGSQRRYFSTEAVRQQEAIGNMSNPLLSSLHTLGRRSVSMQHPRSRHLYRAIQDRAASSASKRSTSKQKPIFKPSFVSSPRASDAAGSPPSPEKQSRDSRFTQPLPQNPSGRSHAPNQQPATTPIRRPTLQRPRTSGMQGSIQNSPEYKSASRKWVASIIALPIFIVTSYFLFDRCRLPSPGWQPLLCSVLIFSV